MTEKFLAYIDFFASVEGSSNWMLIPVNLLSGSSESNLLHAGYPSSRGVQFVPIRVDLELVSVGVFVCMKNFSLVSCLVS